jgi:hypothetical protein
MFLRLVIKEAYRAASKLIRLAVILFVIGSLTIAHHGHNVWEHNAWTIVLVRINKDTEPFEFIHGSEDWTSLRALFREPESHAIAVECLGAADFEFYFDLYGILASLLITMFYNSVKCVPTSQFVAVNGTREKIQPVLE